MPSTCQKRITFHNHKGRAKQAGIEFLFSFEEWVAWWENHLGPDWLSKRGCKKGQYVMARHGDRGPYTASNVKCVTAIENNAEGHHPSGVEHFWARLTPEQVAEARALYKPFSSEFGMRALGRKYKVSHGAMQKVIHSKTWKSVRVS